MGTEAAWYRSQYRGFGTGSFCFQNRALPIAGFVSLGKLLNSLGLDCFHIKGGWNLPHGVVVRIKSDVQDARVLTF